MDKKILTAMRVLHRAGVTNFVVNDDLYNRLLVQQEIQNNRLGEPIAAIGRPKHLLFQGKPIFRQSDMPYISWENGEPVLTAQESL